MNSVTLTFGLLGILCCCYRCPCVMSTDYDIREFDITTTDDYDIQEFVITTIVEYDEYENRKLTVFSIDDDIIPLVAVTSEDVLSPLCRRHVMRDTGPLYNYSMEAQPERESKQMFVQETKQLFNITRSYFPPPTASLQNFSIEQQPARDTKQMCNLTISYFSHPTVSLQNFSIELQPVRETKQMCKITSSWFSPSIKCL